MAYRSAIEHVAYGSAATAGVVSTPDQQLENNIDYLKTLFETARLGEALFIRDATVKADVLVGMPVFYNTTTQQYEKALAGVELQAASGTYSAAATADVIGVCHSKTHSTLADLLVLGTAELDISNAVSGLFVAGRYYLSSGTAGMLTLQRPPATVSVLFAYNDGRITVVPDMKDFLEDHIHFTFDLHAVPAGAHSPPAAGNNHYITSPDDTATGWLPVSEFSCDVPTGAKFGYNMATHAELLQVWPPIPLEAVVLNLYRQDSTPELRGEVPDEYVQFDQNGIWWMSRCYGSVPWPTDYDSTASSSASSAPCPAEPEMDLKLSFIRMTFATNKTLVTSIKSSSDLLTIVGCDGEPSSTGDLWLDIIFEYAIEDTSAIGYKVVKTLDSDTGKLQRGQIAEGVIAGQNMTITSTASRYLVPGNAATDKVYQGLVTLNADTNPLGSELAISLVRLNDVRQRYTGLSMYLAWPEGQTSSIVGKIDVPPVGLPAAPTITLRFMMLATIAGTPPTMTLTCTHIVRPVGTPTLPGAIAGVVLDVPAIGACAANDYFEVDSAAIPVTAGETLFFELERTAGDAYAGEIGVLRPGGIIG